MTDPRTAPERMLDLGRGYCGPKHYLLAEMYRRLGYDVVFATFPFLWNDPDIRYPEDLRQLAQPCRLPTTLPAGSGSMTAGSSWMRPGTGP